MKKRILLMVAICLLVIPISVFAKEGEGAGSGFKSLNFRQTLAEEALKEEFSNYSENNKQITIYMFRGKGCGYCRAFLSYINSITEEYGDKFKVVTYAITFGGDQNPENTELFDAVANYLDGKEAGGVPYVIIGNQVFPGYIDSWNEDIVKAINTLYESNDRYDVFDAMRADGYKFNSDGTIDIPSEGVNSSKGTSSVATIIWSFVFTTISTIIIIVVLYIQNKKLNMRVDELENILKKNKGSVKNA